MEIGRQTKASAQLSGKRSLGAGAEAPGWSLLEEIRAAPEVVVRRRACEEVDPRRFSLLPGLTAVSRETHVQTHRPASGHLGAPPAWPGSQPGDYRRPPPASLVLRAALPAGLGERKAGELKRGLWAPVGYDPGLCDPQGRDHGLHRGGLGAAGPGPGGPVLGHGPGQLPESLLTEPPETQADLPSRWYGRAGGPGERKSRSDGP